MLKYKLRFQFENDDNKSEKRNDNIDILLSDVNLIVSDTPIRCPVKSEVIHFGDSRWSVESNYLSFEKEEGITYYITNVLLKKIKNKSIDHFDMDQYPWDDDYNGYDDKKHIKYHDWIDRLKKTKNTLK